jgi:L,D-transpeptidase YcbB
MSQLPFLGALTALVLASGATACGDDKTIYQSGGSVFRSWNPAGVSEIGSVPIAEFKTNLGGQLARRPDWATEDQWTHVTRLYKGYQNAPLWMDEDGLLEPRADALVDALVQSTSDGIALDHAPLDELIGVLDTIERAKSLRDKGPKPSAATWARADLLLTTAYVGLAEDMLTGQVDPTTVGQSWHIDPQEDKIDSAITLALRGRNMPNEFAKMRPQDAEYAFLRERLEDYRKLVANGGWPSVPAGKSLKRGDRADPARLSALRARLEGEGIDAGASDSVFDESFAAAMAQFQERHGIVVDSQLGSETLDALNVPAADRLMQIAANLERHRWLPRTLGSRYVWVNVPAFKLAGYENGEKTIEMKVIVGAEYDGRATPVFSDKMEYVVFRPYWNVPPTIAANELFPQFAAQGMPADYETYTENGELRIRQVPGERNALGLVKFLFPNDFNIYLHDTPQDKLFEKDIRAFSHGCIRVEKPAELAQWVLGWDRGRVESAMHGGNNRTITLKNKIPVYITYMTVFARDGNVWFGNDLYRRDSELGQALASGALPSAEAARAVAALRKLTD